MKITIYELIGLVKDGKAPKRIKYNDEFWCYSNSIQDYDCLNATNYLLGGLFDNLTIDTFINNEVEIIEEPKKIEKIEMVGCNVRVPVLNNELVGTDTPLALETTIVKVNELIDEINKLKVND